MVVVAGEEVDAARGEIPKYARTTETATRPWRPAISRPTSAPAATTQAAERLTKATRECSAPDRARDPAHQLQLRLRVGGADPVALHGRGEAALGTQRQPLQRHEPGCVGNPPGELAGVLQPALLGRHQAEDDGPVLGH